MFQDLKDYCVFCDQSYRKIINHEVIGQYLNQATDYLLPWCPLQDNLLYKTWIDSNHKFHKYQKLLYELLFSYQLLS